MVGRARWDERMLSVLRWAECGAGRRFGDHYDFGYDAVRPTGGFQGVLDEVIVYDWVIPAAGVNKLAAPM